MNEIKKVLLCGLGGLGCICASQIYKYSPSAIKILVDEQRYIKYRKENTYFNNTPYSFEYILPNNTEFKADLIIIATKNNGLRFAIESIKNFVKEDTIFISLLNGIMSEEEIAAVYGWQNILMSFYIGHSCIRDGRNITLTGTYKFLIGENNHYKNTDKLQIISKFFNTVGINYEISNRIYEGYWSKFIINVGINQLSAVTVLTLKQIKKDEKLIFELKGLMKEAQKIAQAYGITNTEKIYKHAEKFLLEELEDACPSMLQDIKAGRKTEVNIFSGTVIQLGNKYGIETPFNTNIYKKIKELESSQIKII